MQAQCISIPMNLNFNADIGALHIPLILHCLPSSVHYTFMNASRLGLLQIQNNFHPRKLLEYKRGDIETLTQRSKEPHNKFEPSTF